MKKIFFIVLPLILGACDPKNKSSVKKYTKTSDRSLLDKKKRLEGPNDFFCSLPNLAFDLNYKVQEAASFTRATHRHCSKDLMKDAIGKAYICDLTRLQNCVLVHKDFHVIPKKVESKLIKWSLCSDATHSNCPLCAMKEHTSDIPADPNFCREAFDKRCEGILSDENFLELCYVEKHSDGRFSFGYVGEMESREGSLRNFTGNKIEDGLRQPSDCLLASWTGKDSNGKEDEWPMCWQFDQNFLMNGVRNAVANIQSGIASQYSNLKALENSVKKKWHLAFGKPGIPEKRRPGVFQNVKNRFINPTCVQLHGTAPAFGSPEEAQSYFTETDSDKRKELTSDQFPPFTFLLLDRSEAQKDAIPAKVVQLGTSYEESLALGKRYWILKSHLSGNYYNPKVCKQYENAN